MNIFFFNSIISISIAILFLFILFFLYIINKKLKQKEIRYKKALNFLELVDFKTKLESIDNLADFEGKFESLINMSFNFQEEYKQKINLTKENLVYLNKLNSNYNFLVSIKISKKISKDIFSLYDSLNEHDEKILSSKLLLDSLANILIDYVALTNATIFFYEKNIMRKYDNNYIFVLINSLREELKNFNELKKNFDISEFSLSISKINNFLKEIINLIKSWYITDKICAYINSNIHEIEKTLVNGIKTIRNRDNNVVEKNLSIIKNKYRNICNELKFAEFGNIESDIKECFIAIKNINSKIEYTLKTNIFYSKYLEVISKWLSKIKDEEIEIKNSLNKIYKNFNQNTKVFDQTKYMYDLTKSLVESYKSIKYEKSIENLTAEKYIFFINKTINTLYTWVISLDSLIKYLEDKYLNFSYFIKEIASHKFSIAKIMGAISEHEIYDDSINSKTFNLFKELEDIENAINKNFKRISFNKISDALINIKGDLIEARYTIKKDITLKFYSEKLLIYSNRYLINNPPFKYKILKAEEYYYKKNYKKVIDFLVKEIKKVN